MRFEVNVDKKYFFAFVLIGLVVIGIVGVIAYNSVPPVPSKFGHSVDEIEWSQTITKNVTAAGFCMTDGCKTLWSQVGGGFSLTCAAGQVPKWTNGAWACGADDTASATGGISTSICTTAGQSGYVAKWTGTGWECGVDATGGAGQWAASGTTGIIYNGNVGIGTGTASPYVKLDVRADANYNTGWSAAQLQVAGSSNSNRKLIIGYSTTDATNFGFIQAGEQGGNYKNLLLNPNGGKVGIGTTSPGGLLEIKSGDARIYWQKVLADDGSEDYYEPRWCQYPTACSNWGKPWCPETERSDYVCSPGQIYACCDGVKDTRCSNDWGARKVECKARYRIVQNTTDEIVGP